MGNFRRLYTRLLVLAAAIVIVFLSINRNVYAAAPEITSPKATANILVGDTVTVKVSLGRVTDTRYVHCKITKDGERVLYTSQKAPTAIISSSQVQQKFTPETEGQYLIEVLFDKTADVSYEDFSPDTSVTITVRKDLSKEGAATVSGISDKVYTGSEITQDLTVQTSERTLHEETDYDVSYTNNVEPGTATVAVTGKGLYQGTITKTFTIMPADITRAAVIGVVDKKYTSNLIKQSPKVILDGRTLEEGTDYTLSYKDNINAGTATMTITGTGHYEGTIPVAFSILTVPITETTITRIRDQVYNGQPKTQTRYMDISYAGYGIHEDIDYILEYENNIEPGTATMTITGIGNFRGSTVRTFSILEPEPSVSGVGTSIVAPADGAVYQVGSPITVKAGAGLYQPTYVNGSIVQGDCNYIYVKVTKGDEVVHFEYMPYHSASEIVETSAFTLPEEGDYLVAAQRTNLLIRDYKVYFLDEDTFAADTAITVHASADSPDAKEDIAGAVVTGLTDMEYTGSSIIQDPTVTYGGRTLVKGTDYYLTFTTNVNVGPVGVTVHGMGHYMGVHNEVFYITPKLLADDMIVLRPDAFPYTGELQKPETAVYDGETQLAEGKVYTVENEGGIEPGSYSVTITAKSGTNYTGTASKAFSIGTISLEQTQVSVSPSVYVYDGFPKEPVVTVLSGDTVIPSDWYTAEYSGNVDAGEGTVTITANASTPYLTGSVTAAFAIAAHDLTASDVTVGEIADLVYNRRARTPKVSVQADGRTLAEDTDYTLSYSDNTNAGEASVSITGTGNYKGTRTVTFRIAQKEITDSSITIDTIPAQLLNSVTALTPDVTVRDGSTVLGDTDYSVSYKNNDREGTATATVTGTGNYKGSREVYFEILDPATITSRVYWETTVNESTGQYTEIKASWVKYLGASSYIVALYKDGTMVSQTSVTDTTYDVSEKILKEGGFGSGTYTVEVLPVVYPVPPVQTSDELNLDMHTLTINLFGHGENIVVRNVKDRTNIARIVKTVYINTLSEDTDEPEYYLDKGQALFGFSVMPYYFVDDLDELIETSLYLFPGGQTSFGDRLVLDGDGEVCANWFNIINKVELTVTPPDCGTVTNTPKSGAAWQWDQQTNAPAAEVPSGKHYDLDNTEGSLGAWWVSAEDSDIPFAGTMHGGESYAVQADLLAELGYLFPYDDALGDMTVTMNGEEITDYYASYTDYGHVSLSVIGNVEAVHQEETVSGKDPTCTEPGLTDGTVCPACGDTMTAQEEIPANGHTEQIVEGKEATCTEDGLTDGKVCSVCGETLLEQEVIPALGHKEETVPGKAATCTEDGLTEGKKCSVCGETLVEQEVIPALGHKEETVPGKAATCTEDGLTDGKVCSVCGEVLLAQEVIPAGHKEEVVPGKEATCTEDGLTDGKVCSVCGEVLVAQEVIPAGHKEEAVPGKAATCTEDGLTDGKVCSVCGATLLEQEVIPALGHKEEVVPGKAATCTEDGFSEGTRCSVCGVTLSGLEAIPAAGHIEAVVKGKEPTETETGLTDGKVCSVCGEVLQAQEVIPALGGGAGSGGTEPGGAGGSQAEGSEQSGSGASGTTETVPALPQLRKERTEL